jgi:peptidyl-prolyl cis-trans isomerase D
MSEKKKSGPLVWLMLGLLIIALGGFGATGLSGTVRTVGTVGDATIDVQDYARGLRQELRTLEAETGGPVSFNEALQMGATDAVLAQLIAAASFDHETSRIGLSIGDENLIREIQAMQQFRGVDGSFNREGYSFALEQAGLSEAQFEEDMREETARSILQAAVISGVRLPESYVDTLLGYLGEQRDISFSILERGDLQLGVPVPSDSDLAAFHEENAEDYTLPETKRITYAWLTPEMLIDTVEVDETALREAYEAREAEFNQPERRLVERLVFADEAAAEAAAAELDADETSFDELVAARGLELSDIDLGDVTREALGAAADRVFAAQVGDVVGPAPSDLGPALFRVNAKLSAQVTSFAEAQPELRTELAADRAVRVVENQIDPVDNLLAGGATIEDLAQETEMQLGEIAWHDGMTDEIGAYEAFRAAARAVNASDYPEVLELEDGGIFALRLDEVVPPSLQPLAEVREAVEAAWRDRAVAEALRQEAEPLVNQISAEGDFDAAGLPIDGASSLSRRSFNPDIPQSLLDTVFDMQEGEVALVEGLGRLYVVKLETITPPSPEDEDLQQLQGLLQNQAASGLGQDLFQLFANDIRSRAGIELDQSAINAVHANFQ